MICNTIGLTTDSFETLYVRGGAEVPEVYGSINYAQPVFYSLKTLTGATSYSFMGYPEPLKSYEISGNMVRTGTPTPTSPIYPQECGDLEENVAIINSRSDTITNWYYTDVRLSDELPAGTYTISFMMDSKTGTATSSSLGRGNTNTYQVDVDNYQIPEAPANIKRTITLNSNACIWARFLRSATPATFSYSVSKIAIARGNKPYGQYKIPLNLNGTTQNLYLTEPLRKIGGYADVVNSGGTVVRRLLRLVLTGTENWVAGVYSGHRAFQAYAPKSQIGTINCICSHYRALFREENNVIYFVNAQSKRFVIFDDRFTTDTEFKTFLAAQYAAGAPVTIWYVIANPTTEAITSPAVTPITGSNTLLIGTTLAPSSVSITGHVKPTSS